MFYSIGLPGKTTIWRKIELIKKLGGDIVGIALLIELPELNGREKLQNLPIFSLFLV